MAHRRSAGGCFDDDGVVVDESDRDVVDELRQALGAGKQLDAVALLQAAGGIEPELAVDSCPAAGYEVANLGPRLTGEPAAQEGGEGLIGLISRHFKGLAFAITH